MITMLKSGRIGVWKWNRWRRLAWKNAKPIDGAWNGIAVLPPEVRHIDLHMVDLACTNLTGVNFHNTDLQHARLVNCNLRKANLQRANLWHAFLSGSDLRKAKLDSANLEAANLVHCDMTGADLQACNLVRANLQGANISNCRVYGISAWDVELAGAVQQNLIVSRPTEPEIRVDNLEVAQFIHLLINNANIRRVIDTITSKVVLILGRFTPERKAVLDALREELRRYDYVPIVFDSKAPRSRNFIETVSTLAHLARFVIADVTDPKIVLEEIPHIVRNISVPVQPLLLYGSGDEPVTLGNLRQNQRSLLDTYVYKNLDDLLSDLQSTVIIPAEKKARELLKP